IKLDYDVQLSRFCMTGVTATLCKRLQCPYNYFQVNTSLSFKRYKLQNYGGYFLFDNGTAYNMNITQEISRNSVDAPIYPTSGSHFKFSVHLTPPYSACINIDYQYASI